MSQASPLLRILVFSKRINLDEVVGIYIYNSAVLYSEPLDIQEMRSKNQSLASVQERRAVPPGFLEKDRLSN